MNNFPKFIQLGTGFEPTSFRLQSGCSFHPLLLPLRTLDFPPVDSSVLGKEPRAWRDEEPGRPALSELHPEQSTNLPRPPSPLPSAKDWQFGIGAAAGCCCPERGISALRTPARLCRCLGCKESTAGGRVNDMKRNTERLTSNSSPADCCEPTLQRGDTDITPVTSRAKAHLLKDLSI